MSNKKKLLVIGANGQIGTVLTNTLLKKHGADNVIGSDISKPNEPVPENKSR